MTSADDIQVVRRFHEAFAAGDIDGVLECVHPEMEFDWSESQAPFRGVYRAHDGLRSYWADVQDAWEWFRPEVEDVMDCGIGHLVTPTTVRGRARASGIELAAHGAMHWVVRDAKIVRGKLFQTTDEALQAARAAA